MIAKLIAFLLIVVLQFVVSGANYWYTFGIWPKSWLSFILCAMASMTLTGLAQAVSTSK